MENISSKCFLIMPIGELIFRQCNNKNKTFLSLFFLSLFRTQNFFNEFTKSKYKSSHFARSKRFDLSFSCV